MLSYTDSASAREVKGSVARRGLCGDVYLVSTPPGPRIGDVKVETSVRKRGDHIRRGARESRRRTRVTPCARGSWNGGRTRQGIHEPAVSRRATSRRAASQFTEKWKPEKLWDIHTPQNIHASSSRCSMPPARCSMSTGRVRFGFREFWIDGRDFYLNGTRIHLSAVPLDNAQIGAAWPPTTAARESLERLKSFGINFVYTHNYDCEPGSHLELRGNPARRRRRGDARRAVAAAFQPLRLEGARRRRNNGYARHAAFYARVAQNHPSVVIYSMSHNATGYDEDMNPDMIDGMHDPRDTWSREQCETGACARKRS